MKKPNLTSRYRINLAGILLGAGLIVSCPVMASGNVSTGLIVQQQKMPISGTVVDQNGIPVIGADVMEKGVTSQLIY